MTTSGYYGLQSNLTTNQFLIFNFSRKKHVCCTEFYSKSGKQIWKASSFYRWYGTWYPYACKFLKLRHHLHSSFEKSIIERTIQYIKDRIENFDDYFLCRKKRCKLNHVTNWFNVFVDSYNTSMAP
jgi:putative transposase